MFACPVYYTVWILLPPAGFHDKASSDTKCTYFKRVKSGNKKVITVFNSPPNNAKPKENHKQNK